MLNGYLFIQLVSYLAMYLDGVLRHTQGCIPHTTVACIMVGLQPGIPHSNPTTIQGLLEDLPMYGWTGSQHEVDLHCDCISERLLGHCVVPVH